MLTTNIKNTPFGTILDGRTFGISGRNKFNGKENDGEISGGGNIYDYGFRIYNPRLGRFLSVDPLTKDYPELSSYIFASNTPIQAEENEGKQAVRPVRTRVNIALNNRVIPPGYNIHKTYRPIYRPQGATTPVPVRDEPSPQGEAVKLFVEASEDLPPTLKDIKSTFTLKESTFNAHDPSKSKTQTELVFDNPKDQAIFDKVQAAYDKAYDHAKEGITAPDIKNYDFTKQGEAVKYKGDVAGYKLKVAIATQSLGKSPKEILSEFAKSNKTVFVEEKVVEKHASIGPGE